VFDRETIDFLESGCALIVATVSADGEPHAGRGWGLLVAPGDDDRVRLLVDALDSITVENMETTGRIAITAANVPTLRSAQLKGRAVGVSPAADADRTRAAEFCNRFFTDIVETDGTDRRLPERLVPLDYVACDVTVEEFYDQTPGPGAGGALSRNRP
jgi:hypothetical protein